MTYAKSKETIQGILEVARTLFTEKNYADVTINDIVTHASISKGAVYHHFASKEDVYLKMMHHYLAEIQAITQHSAETSSGSCRERLRQSVFSFLEIPEELLRILRLVRRDINIFNDPVRHDLICAYQTAVPEQVETIIRDGIANGELPPVDARMFSRQMVALVEVTLHPYSRRIVGSTEQMADFVVTLFFDGINGLRKDET
jgi:AcrR family transcriptional regulator